MSTFVKVGSFAKRSGSGTQDVTGLGWNPASGQFAVVFWSTGRTSTGFGDGVLLSHGFDDGTRAHVVGLSSDDNVNPTHTDRIRREDASIAFVSSGGFPTSMVQASARITALITDGFRLTWPAFTGGSTNLDGAIIHYLAIGGTSISAKVDYFRPGVAPWTAARPGDQPITGVGFQPTGVLMLASYTAGSATTDQATIQPEYGFGWMDDEGHQGAVSLFAAYNLVTSNTLRYQRTDRCSLILGFSGTPPGAVVDQEVSAVSMDSDGFTIHLHTSTTGLTFPYLAISGITIGAGSTVQPSGTGQRVYTTTGAPIAALFASVNHTTSTSLENGLALSLGGTDGSTHEATWIWDEDNVSPSQGSDYTSTSTVLALATGTATGSSSSIDAEVDDVSFAGNLVTVNWSQADATAREVIFLLFGAKDPVEAITIADCTVTATYEDPCAIKTPHFVIALKDVDDTVTWAAQQGLRNSASSWSGGYVKPMLLDISPIMRVASDWRTGAWPVQSVTFTLADTNRYWRDAIDAADGDLVNARLWACLISEVGRQAGTTLRALFSGTLYEDRVTSHLRYEAIGNDVIGVNYSLHADEVMIPQRPIEDDFPGYGYQNTTSAGAITVLGAPIIGGEVSDEDPLDWPDGQTTQQGVVQLIYVGTMTCLDATVRHVGLLAGHPCKSVVNLYQGDNAHTIVTFGTNAFAPGKTNWSTVNPDGAALYTEVNGRWYTLCFFNTSTSIGDDFADGTTPIYANVEGFEDVGDGTGNLITDLHLQYKHCLLNFFLPTPAWEKDAWLASPQFELYPGGPVICQVKTGSFSDAASVANGYLGGGFVGGFVIGHGGQQMPLRQILQQFNVQANVSLGWNAYSQLFVSMLDRDRTNFLGGRRTISDRRDILTDPAFEAPFDRSLLANNLRYAYRTNYNTGEFDAINQIGDSASLSKYEQSFLADPESYTLIREDDTAGAVAQQRLDLMAFSRRTPTWAESLCGLRNDILDGVPLTHFNGPGASGYVDRALWIRSQTIDPRTCKVTCKALDVDDLLT